MNNKDYGEVFLQSTEQIVDSKLSMVKFDQTIICTITDDSNAFNGEYQVSDGSVTFTAYSENKNYIKNMQVYVLIPQGNWANRKQITALYSKSESAIINYVSELEKLMVVSSVSIDDDGKDDFADGGVRYSDDENQPPCVVFIPSASGDIEPNYNTELTNTLCIRFKLQTQKFSTDDLSDYQFGVKVSIYPRHYGESTPNEEESISFDYTNSQMLGNPFYYFTPTQQEIVYHIDSKLMPFIGHIGLELIREEDNTPENCTALMDIKITDIQIYLCHDVSQYENNTVLLFPTCSQATYDGSDEDDLQKQISIIWVNKDSEGRYIGFKDGQDNSIAIPNIEKATDNSKLELTIIKNGLELPGPDYQKKYYWIDWYIDTNRKKLEFQTRPQSFVSQTNKTQIDFLIHQKDIGLLETFITTDVQAVVWVNGEAYKSKVFNFKNIDISQVLSEETLRRLNYGGRFDTASAGSTGFGGGRLFWTYPKFDGEGNIDGGFIKFDPSKSMSIASLSYKDDFGVKIPLSFTITSTRYYLDNTGTAWEPSVTISTWYADSPSWELRSEKNLKEYISDNFNFIWVDEDTNTFKIEFICPDSQIPPPTENNDETELAPPHDSDTFIFENISSIGFITKKTDNNSISGEYLLDEKNLLVRLNAAEARIQQLEKQLSAYI